MHRRKYNFSDLKSHVDCMLLSLHIRKRSGMKMQVGTKAQHFYFTLLSYNLNEVIITCFKGTSH